MKGKIFPRCWSHSDQKWIYWAQEPFSFFFPLKYQENVQPLSISLTLYFLYFHAVKTEVNGANPKVTGAALFGSHQRQRLLFSEGRKGASLYWLSFHYPVFSGTAVSYRVAFSVAKSDSPVSPFYKNFGTKVSFCGFLSVNLTQHPVSIIKPVLKTQIWSNQCVSCIWEAKAMCLSCAHVSIAAQPVFICWGVVWRVCVLEGDAEKGDGMKETWIEGWREGGVK